ncbi:MAG: glutamate 5-kinase, partial [Kiritimatiellae bacterium]|nr:glutamate 5-kinase [Kiritimatiellia bacterium]
PDLQMAAAVGQTRLMSRYDSMLAARGCKIGQVLLTHTDFRQKIRLTNVRRTLDNLIRNKVIPIINENDVVTDEEIRADQVLGDNDLLASLVVKLIRADLLIMLTTVDGLRRRLPSGRTERVKYLETISAKTLKLAGQSSSNMSKGGMQTKLKAAQSASNAGCSAVIASGHQSKILSSIMNGDDVGTLVLASAI